MHDYEGFLKKSGFTLIGGIDEAGRGPLAGPVVAACCILPDTLEIASLDDSKKLSPKKRDEIYKLLIEHPDVVYGIGSASAQEIDEINILQATFEAMKRAVEDLPCSPDYLLIDGNRAPQFQIPLKTIVGGDALCRSIAAASILAKVTRDTLMLEVDQKRPEYGFKKHKGYGTKDHIAAIKKWGPSSEHRRSFAPIKDEFLRLTF